MTKAFAFQGLLGRLRVLFRGLFKDGMRPEIPALPVVKMLSPYFAINKTQEGGSCSILSEA
jgi:hypothetical protein